jgi:hypothetical protein
MPLASFFAGRRRFSHPAIGGEVGKKIELIALSSISTIAKS